MLKFENLAKVGDVIRGYDFESSKDYFIEGKVVAKDWVIRDGMKLYKAYHIEIARDGLNEDASGKRVGDIGYIPMESMFDYDDRIEVINE